MEKKLNVLKVSNKTNVNSLAGMIAACVRNGEAVELQTIGAGALNQAVKAYIVAKGFVAQNGLTLRPDFGFTTATINDEEKTTIRMPLSY